MRKLVFVLGALALATAAACGGGSSGGLITANWSFQTVSGSVIPDCPPTFNTAAVHATPVGTTATIIDLYDCQDFSGTSDYPIDDYDVFVAITTDGGGGLYGQTLTGAVDLTSGDKTYTAQLLDDGGYFEFDWTMKGAATNATLDCIDVNPDSIEIQSTLIGPNTLKTDKFDCEDEHGITAGLLAGDYTISVSANDTVDGTLGTSPAENTAILDHNGLTDLGLITIPITGM
jgi:hypothetical protein